MIFNIIQLFPMDVQYRPELFQFLELFLSNTFNTLDNEEENVVHSNDMNAKH